MEHIIHEDAVKFRTPQGRRTYQAFGRYVLMIFVFGLQDDVAACARVGGDDMTQAELEKRHVS